MIKISAGIARFKFKISSSLSRKGAPQHWIAGRLVIGGDFKSIEGAKRRAKRVSMDGETAAGHAKLLEVLLPRVTCALPYKIHVV